MRLCICGRFEASGAEVSAPVLWSKDGLDKEAPQCPPTSRRMLPGAPDCTWAGAAPPAEGGNWAQMGQSRSIWIMLTKPLFLALLLSLPPPNPQRQPSPAKNKPKSRDLDTPGRGCKKGRAREMQWRPPPLLRSLQVLILCPFRCWAHRKQDLASVLHAGGRGWVLFLCLMRMIRINHVQFS